MNKEAPRASRKFPEAPANPAASGPPSAPVGGRPRPAADRPRRVLGTSLPGKGKIPPQTGTLPAVKTHKETMIFPAKNDAYYR